MASFHPEPPLSLPELEARLRQDLAVLNLPPANWVTPTEGAADVLIIGGGMLGLAASFALTRLGILNHRVLDQAPAGREGPWVTYARMETLRSPKHLTGPGGDIAGLTFRAWHTAQHGEAGWEALAKIPRAMWQDYLNWFRAVLALPVNNGTTFDGIEPAGDGLITVATSGGPIRTRHLVLATGRDGLGGPRIPDWVPNPRGPRIRHSSEAVDFTALFGKHIAVVGASASAVDNAATALEHGAAEAHLLVRRHAIPVLNRFKSMVHPGFTHGMPGLEDATRLAFLQAANEGAVAPPRESLMRLARQPGFRLHLGAPIAGAAEDASGVTLTLPTGPLRVDQVILGTGFTTDLASRPELAAIAPDIRLWRDAVTDPGEFAAHPHLGPSFEFEPRVPGTARWLPRIHAFNIAAIASLGLISGDIPGVSDGARRLSENIAAALFRADAPTYLARLRAYADLELLGDEVAPQSVFRPD
jgi:cation diffusion facilitator CzcD-associated flavoprotein CzcO